MARVARQPDVAALKAAVHAAVVASRTPPTPDASEWPLTFPQQHLDPAAWSLVWDVVRYIRREQRDLYRKFLQPRTIADFVIDYLAETKPNVTLKDVVADLRARAAEVDWLFDIPLLNVVPPRETVPLGKRAMLVRTDWARRGGIRDGPYLKDIWAVKKHLGDELTPRNRWLMASRARDVDLDTRKMASLLLVVHGTQEVAHSVAHTNARLVVAMWCLLAPPRSQFDPMPLWPTIGGFTPAAHTEFGIQHKLYEPQFGFSRARRHGAHITDHAPYALTRSDRYLRAPFDALAKARRGNQCALALLSAARSLYLASRVPNDLDRTERIVFAWRAKEALTHRGVRGQGSADQRWQRLIVNLRLRNELTRRGYDRDEIDEASSLVESWRDLTTHLADDVLINLSYPPQLRTRLIGNRVLGVDDAALAVVASDWPIILSAVRTAARRLTKGAIVHNWDERWFHRRFV
jgi:hypothetical protein